MHGMKKRRRTPSWASVFQRSLSAMTRMTKAASSRSVPKTPASRRVAQALKPLAPRRVPASTAGSWLPGVVMGAAGARRYGLYRPPGVKLGERLPLMVMLHGCGQDAAGFAAVTRMNRIAMKQRFLVLYPEQDRLANVNACWNWYDIGNGRAYGEAALIMKMVDHVCLLYPADRARVAVAGLSAGASMAALLVTRYPGRFKAVIMHSGIPPGTAHSGLSALGAMRGRRATVPLAATPEAMQAHWPPLLVIHGDADHVVAPANGRAAAQAWAQAAGAREGAAREVQRGQRYAAAVTDFKQQGRTVATLVAVDGLAHAWSGGAASQPFSDALGPDASRMAWAFAARQFRLA